MVAALPPVGPLGSSIPMAHFLIKIYDFNIKNMLDYLNLSSGKAPCDKKAHVNKKPRGGSPSRTGSARFGRLTPVCILFLSFFLFAAKTLSSKLLFGN